MTAGSVLRSRATLRVARLLAIALLALATPIVAQDPAPRDTVAVPQDTAIVRIPPEQVAQDTLPRAEPTAAEDSLLPAPNLPVFTRAPATGFGLARWEWGAEELARWHGHSILDLLERVPGILVTRAGWYGRPAGIAAFGLGGGRIRVFLDGWEMDPLEAGVFDVQHLAIVDLEALRVERDLGEIRVELFTFRLPDRRAFSQIEAGTALFRTRILRGLFATPTGARGVLAVGLDINDTDGWLGTQPFAANGVLARWGYQLTETTGVQAEFRQTSVERGRAPFAFDGDRRDVLLRARSRPLPGLALDALVGQSTRTPGEIDTIQTRLSSTQGSFRARYDVAPGWIGGGVRLRGADRVGYAAPTLALSGEAGLRPARWLEASGRVWSTRVAEQNGTELEGGVRLGPIAGLSVFASGASGTRPLGLVRDSVFTFTVPPAEPGAEPGMGLDTTWVFPAFSAQLRAFRAGAEWTGWGARVGAAYLSHDTDRVAPFGLAFDRTLEPRAVGPASGVEAFWSVPLLYGPLRLEGSATHWLDRGGRPYLPEQHGRVGIVFNERFYEGNLEPTLRAEAVRRTAALVPTAARDGFTATSPGYTVYNLLLQIRVLDVRAFLIWDNILNNQTVNDLVGPERFQGGQRVIYGVRWHFFD